MELGGYKIGPALTTRPGCDVINETARAYSNKPLIYDGQKLWTDIPETAKPILTSLRDSGIDTVILFPLSGPKTQEFWIKTAQDLGLGVLVGGEMPHPKFKVSEGGYIVDSAIEDIYFNAADFGVTDFVVPGNRIDSIERIKRIVDSSVKGELVFYAPGFIVQGGEITEARKAIRERFHPIVGRGIYEAENMEQAALDLTRNI